MSKTSSLHQGGTPSIRRITVCCKAFSPCGKKRRGGAAAFPMLRLCGPWLQEAGFEAGQVVNIVCQPGQLTVTIAQEQTYEAVQALLQREPIGIV